MPTVYTYSGKTKKGEAKKGEITANSLEEAKSQLAGQGIIPTNLQEKKKGFDFAALLGGGVSGLSCMRLGLSVDGHWKIFNRSATMSRFGDNHQPVLKSHFPTRFPSSTYGKMNGAQLQRSSVLSGPAGGDIAVFAYRIASSTALPPLPAPGIDLDIGDARDLPPREALPSTY